MSVTQKNVFGIDFAIISGWSALSGEPETYFQTYFAAFLLVRGLPTS